MKLLLLLFSFASLACMEPELDENALFAAGSKIKLCEALGCDRHIIIDSVALQSAFAQFGFTYKAICAGMVRVLNYSEKPEPASGDFRVQIVLRNDDFVRWCSVLESSFGLDHRATCVYASLFQLPNADPYFIHVAGISNGKVLAIGSLLVTDEGGYLYHVGTLPDQRKKGYASAVVNKLLALAHEKKLPRVGLVANQELMSFYQKLGFRKACTIGSYEQSGY